MKLVLKRFFIFLCFYFSATAVNIDDKLDFEDSNNRPSFRTHITKHTSNTVPLKYTKTTLSTTNDDFDTIGVVCTSGGCNKTTVEPSNDSKDSVKADVVVHVETKVNLNQDKNKSDDILEDTPDVPVVVGYAGSRLDSTIEDGNRGLGTPQSIYIPNNVDTKTTYQNNINNGRSYYNQPIGHKGTHRSSLYNPPVFTPIGSKIYPTRVNSVDNYSPSYYSDSLTRSDLGTNRQVKVLSPVALTSTDSNRYNMVNVQYKMNGSHFSVPYFEPSYHNHYYGENPPTQYSWYPKINSNIQGLESKVDNPTWKTNSWQGTGSYRYTSTPVVPATKCICPNGQIGQVEPTTGLQWYPSTKRNFVNDPGSQINDKLAPLN